MKSTCPGRSLTASLLAVALGFAVATAGCSSDPNDGKADPGGGDNASGIDRLFEQQTTAMTAARDKFCTCAVDKEGGWCTSNPDSCFDTLDDCLSELTDHFLILSNDDISCLKQELSASLDKLQAFAACAKNTAVAYNECLGEVTECDYDAVIACGDANENPPCMDAVATEEVKTAFDNCMEYED